jgi:antitoxin ParD1/3/4
MSRYVLTHVAKAHIPDIWRFIAIDNVEAAGRVEQAIYDACAFVAESPARGRLRPDLTTRPLRFWTLTRFSNYIVVYRVDVSPIVVVAILHGNRNIARILK